MKMEFKEEGECFSDIMRCEDHFHASMVFIAGFGNQENPRMSSMMAYGTIIDYAALDKAWEAIKDNYSPACWREMSKYWVYQHYLSPIPVMLVCYIYRQLELKYEIKDHKFVDLEEQKTE